MRAPFWAYMFDLAKRPFSKKVSFSRNDLKDKAFIADAPLKWVPTAVLAPGRGTERERGSDEGP
jgi:hypothetical protein